jgi:2-polyprenyl-3-methyl-5-hydroxy-6-metoxy-1,4-benzoquinol methylase
MLQLDVGSTIKRVGWTSIDVHKQADIVHDVRSRPWPVEGESVKDILASHILEHVVRDEGWKFLGECHRVLAPGGNIGIAVPDMDKFILGHILHDPARYGNWQFNNLNLCLGGGPNTTPPYQNTPLENPDGHKSLYCFESLAYMLERAGFVNIQKVTYETSFFTKQHTEAYKEFSLYVDAQRGELASFEDFDAAGLYPVMMSDILAIETTQAHTLANWLMDDLLQRPGSVIDLGCGPGVYLLPYKMRGCEVLGVDACITGGECLAPEEFERVDLRLPYTPKHKYDLVICLEVAEHIQEFYVEQLIDNICGCGDTVIFTGATPGQGGTYHFNEQPHEYWLKKFAARGYKVHWMQDDLRKFLRGLPTPPYCPWLIHNCFLLVRN